jgi:hypothetical protein
MKRVRRKRARGSVSIETLIVIGLVFLPIWGVMEYLHESALAKGALRQEVRVQTIRFASSPDCETVTRSCARLPLGVTLPAHTVDSRWVDADHDRRDLHTGACAGSTDIENPRAGVEHRGHATVSTCREPTFRAPNVDVESILCGPGGVARGTDLCD